MAWTADSLLKNETNGLIADLNISAEQKKELRRVKNLIRAEIRKTFESIKKAMSQDMNHRWQLNEEVIQKTFSTLVKGDTERALYLIRQLSADQKGELSRVNPRFMTQGSYEYNTLNRPAHSPPQQIDIDDGTYLPLEIFEDKPIVGKELLMLIVDSALRRLQQEYDWEFVAKDTCGRLQVSKEVHVDVPMYVIPRDDFRLKEEALLKANVSIEELSMSRVIDFNDTAGYLKQKCVYLAVRGSDHWRKSDPAVISGWFKKATDEHGERLRRVCRYLKAWRDKTFEKDRPSSIAMMACAVETFDKNTFLTDSDALKACASALSSQFAAGVESPDPTDDGNLFPRGEMQPEAVKDIITRAEEFASALKQALDEAQSKAEVRRIFVSIFGARFTCGDEAIKERASQAVKRAAPVPQPAPNVPNMKSG